MAFIRLQDNVPPVYVNDSRDFQLLCRLYDCVNASVMSDIDTMTNILVSRDCNSVMLDHLATKVGFFPKHNIGNEDLRYIVEAFPYIIKYKGSRRSIEEAINVFLKINNVNSDVYIEIINKTDRPDVEPYTIRIGVEYSIKDTTILDEIFRYILPTGYTVEYFSYNKVTDLDGYMDRNRAFVVIAPDNINSRLKDDEYTWLYQKKPLQK